MKKPIKFRFNGFLLILLPPLLALILFSLSSLSMMTIEYPYERASHWVCEDPEFSLSYKSHSQNGLLSKEVLIWNGEEIPVWIGFGKGDYAVYPKYSNRYDDRLLTGTWKYRTGNLVLRIEEDFIFGGRYKELVFSPTG